MRFCTKPLHECGLGMFYANDLWAHTPSLIIIQIHQHYKQLATDIVCVLLIKPCFFHCCRVWVLWSSHQVMHHMCLPCYLWLNSWLNHSGADSILCWFLLEFLRLLFSNYPVRYLTLLMNVQNWYMSKKGNGNVSGGSFCRWWLVLGNLWKLVD